ncbi:MAG: tail fiber assembly protein [Pantoea vagans]|nr:tail fiber assembly protein [Pantoea vagans]
MGSYALVSDGKVINTILWDGPDTAEMNFGENVTAVELDSSITVNVGYNYSDGEFSKPPLTEEEIEGQKANQIAINTSKKESLMSESGQMISVLQDAVDLDMATDEEESSLLLWKKYRVILSRIDANTGDAVSWPATPV